MNLVSFFRIFKTGAMNFRRNPWLAGASTLIMIVTLVILSVLSLLFVITNYSVQTIQERVDISAYFKAGLAENQILAVRDDLQADPRVKEVTYVSAQKALENFKQKHKNDANLLESVNELSENPLPATLQIKANNLQDYQAIADLLKSDQYKTALDKVNFEDNRVVIERLNSLLRFIVTFGLALMIVFSAIAILVIFNTITLTIYNRREEVEIMRLVGATNWYIRGPFIVEALVYSLVATLITGLLLVPLYFKLLPSISAYITPGADVFTGNLSTFIGIVVILLGIAIVLSTISSLMAIRRYLKI